MAKNYKYLEGIGKWFHKLRDPDSFEGESPKWKFTFYPKNMKEFEALGLKNKIKEDADGKYVQLSRPTVAPWGESMDPPKIIDKDGNPFPEGTIIGNGSRVVVKLDVYNYSVGTTGRKGTAARIDTIKVMDLVEYKAPDKITDAQTEGETAVPF